MACCVGAGFLALVSCGGGSSSSGTPAPLPGSQTGSINYANTALANCFVSDTAACSTSPGTNPISSLAAATINASNYLFWGDGAGNIESTSIPTTTTTLPSTLNNCFSPSLGTKIRSLTVVSTATTGPLFYATTGGVSYIGLTGSQCDHTKTATLTTITTSAFLAFNSATSLVIGVTSTGLYYSCTSTATPTCTSQGTLPSLQDISPRITGIASDPSTSIVYLVSVGNTINRIYAYLVNSTGTLTYLTNYTGIELNSPAGITAFQGNTGTQSYCTTGPCTFLDVTNATNTTITQYVLNYSFSGSTPTGVAINQFNNAYFNCDLIAPTAIAAIPLPGTSGSLNTPNVFVGEAGTQPGPCLGITSTGTYGNNVTAYTVEGE